jgi:hypothetical protein
VRRGWMRRVKGEMMKQAKRPSTAPGAPGMPWGHRHGDLYDGVMADEVERVMPAAVYYAPDGFRRVRYWMLGMKMRRFRNGIWTDVEGFH